MKDHFPILLLMLPLISVPLLAGASMVSAWLGRLMVLAVFVLGFVLGFQAEPLALAQEAWHYHLGGWPAPWGLEIVLTPFTLFFAGWIWLMGLSTWLYALPQWIVRREGMILEGLFNSFLFLVLGSVLGLLFLRDLLGLYLIWELLLTAMAGLILAGQGKNGKEAFDLFFRGTVAASFFLLAVLLLYHATGTLNLDDLLSQIFIAKNSELVLFAGVLIGASLLFFFSLPLPLFYERWTMQIPPFITGFFASVVVRAAAYLSFTLLFFALNLPGFNSAFPLSLLEYGLILAFSGLWIVAFRQKDLQQTILYLGTAQLGTLFMGLFLGTKTALTGTLLELLNQTLCLAGLFYLAGLLKPVSGLLPVSRLAGLARQKPWTGLALIVLAASIVGIPPTVGSLGKWYLLQGALERGNWPLVGLLSLIVLGTLFVFVKLVLLLYEHHEGPATEGLPPALQGPIFLLALAVLLLGVFHESAIQHFIEPALPKAFQNIPMPNVPFLGQQVE